MFRLPDLADEELKNCHFQCPEDACEDLRVEIRHIELKLNRHLHDPKSNEADRLSLLRMLGNRQKILDRLTQLLG